MKIGYYNILLQIFFNLKVHILEVIANKIYKILVEFELKHKTIALTTNNANNIIFAVRYLKAKFEHNIFIYYRCVVHILNIIITTELEIIKLSVKKLRKLIKSIQKLIKILEELENLLKLNNKNFLHPIIDCKTSQNSIYKMIN